MRAAVIEPEVLSWRDPHGFVIRYEGRILRAVLPEKAAQTRELLRAPWMIGLMAEGLIPATHELSRLPDYHGSSDWFWLEHEALAYPCYAHEVTALQHYDAALLTLKLATKAAINGWMLKDASAWNVLFARGRPVFVDMLSFEKGKADGMWQPYGQFVRHYILPLFLHKKSGLTPAEIFLLNRDGVTPERVHELLSRMQLLSPIALEFVVMPKWLARRGSRLIASRSAKSETSASSDMHKAVAANLMKRLKRSLQRLRPETSKIGSVWTGYEEDRGHYTAEDLSTKREFVSKSLRGSANVLDLGCNAGEFSLMAAEFGSIVVAADSDHGALSRLYERVRNTRSSISPMFLNISRPTPAIGWRNKEVGSFFDRSAGKFDCIMCLGLFHHLLVNERVNLSMLADFFHELGARRVICEWVDPNDAKFKQLAGLNASLYMNLNVTGFEDAMARRFRMAAKLVLPTSTRVMYEWVV